MTAAQLPTYTIIQADGLYADDEYEQVFFAPRTGGPQYRLCYIQADLWSPGTIEPKPWSSIPEEIRKQVNGIMLLKLALTAADIELFPSLKVVVRMGVGYDRLDRPALAARHVVVCNVPDYGTNEIADHALALTLTLRRGVLLHHDRQRARPPAPWAVVDADESHGLISRLQSSTFAILGLGRIGTAAALRAKAFGFRVIFFDPYVANGFDKSLQIERVTSLEELFRQAHVLSIHCPCTRETRGLVGFELLRLLPAGAILINTARGEILDLDAVEACLRGRDDSRVKPRLAGAALDVLPEEPIPEERVHPLIRAYRAKEEWLEGRLVLTCHTAFYSPESYVDIRHKSAQTMRDVLIDGVNSNIISPEMD